MKKATVLFLWLPVIAAAQVTTGNNKTVVANGEFSVVEDSIRAKINRGIIPSFSVGVSIKGKVVWQQSFGWADKENKIRATPTTSYALASVSKSITSTAIMVLVEKGYIHLDDPVDRYLGNAKLTCFTGSASPITLTHLLNMTAGIPHQWEYIYSDEKRSPTPIGEQIKRYGLAVFPPGEVFHYSNFSPGIAEHIIQHVTQKSLSAYLKETLFLPLGMNGAAVNRYGLPVLGIAKGYDRNGKLLAISEFYPKAGGGYYASLADLLRYGMFHLKDKEITPVVTGRSIDILRTPADYTAYNKFYAYGWGVLQMGNGMRSLISNGAIDGAASTLLLLPDKDIAIACLTNATVGNDFTDQFAYQMAEILLPGYQAELETFYALHAPAFAEKPFVSADTLTGVWEGEIRTYESSIPIRMVFDSTGRIFVRIKDQFETILNNVTTNQGLIRGECFGKIPLPETREIPQSLELLLRPGKQEMAGVISSQSFQTKRPYFLLPSYLVLRKKKD